MAYTPTVWKNGEFPPIDAEHLNKIEQGIANSAPGGFGWGNTLDYLQSQDGVTTYADFCGMIDGVANTMPGNTAKLIVARGPSETGQYSGAHNMLAILNVGDTSGEVELTGLAPGQNSQGGLWRMIKKSGTWGDPEWINPPMKLGIEYRTTERHLGQPVYCKVLEVSPITDGGTITIEAVQTLRTSVCEVVSVGNFIPVPQVPFQMTSSSLPSSYGMAYYMNVNVIVFVRGANNGSSKAVVTVYYTK